MEELSYCKLLQHFQLIRNEQHPSIFWYPAVHTGFLPSVKHTGLAWDTQYTSHCEVRQQSAPEGWAEVSFKNPTAHWSPSSHPACAFCTPHRPEHTLLLSDSVTLQGDTGQTQPATGFSVKSAPKHFGAGLSHLAVTAASGEHTVFPLTREQGSGCRSSNAPTGSCSQNLKDIKKSAEKEW